jgi:hypothetical protein
MTTPVKPISANKCGLIEENKLDISFRVFKKNVFIAEPDVSVDAVSDINCAVFCVLFLRCTTFNILMGKITSNCQVSRKKGRWANTNLLHLEGGRMFKQVSSVIEMIGKLRF